MAPLFQRLFPAVEEEERPKAVPDNTLAAPSEAAETPALPSVVETSVAGPDSTSWSAGETGAETSNSTENHIPESHEGLIHASKLPSATDTLAQLFAEAATPEEIPAARSESGADASASTSQNPALAKDAAPKRLGLLARLFRSKRAAKEPATDSMVVGQIPEPAAAVDVAVAVASEFEAEPVAQSAASSLEPLVLAEIPDIYAPAAEPQAIAAEDLPSAADELEDLFSQDDVAIISAEDISSGEGLVETETLSFSEETEEALQEPIDEPAEEVPVAVEAISAATSLIAGESRVAEQAEATPDSYMAASDAAEQSSSGETRGAIETSDSEWRISPEAATEIARSTESAVASTHGDISTHDDPITTAEGISAEDSPTEENDLAAVSKSVPQAEPKRLYKDWAFDEKLASHAEWVESHGRTGQRADLSGAELEASDLISVNLRLADLHDANLRASDLLLADLRDACLVRADLEEACLVGANLEGANLEGASLETAMGLVPRQFAGANLRDALLAPHLMEFDAVTAFARESRNAFRYFWMMTAASLLSWLLIAKTRDAQLLTDSAIIPFLHSRTAAAALPTAEAYLIVPVAIFVLYVLFHFHLQRLWDSVTQLPAIFPDGHTLGDSGPGILSGLLRTHFRWMNPDPSSTRLVEKTASLAAAYAIVPITLLLYWIRYLTRQEIHGTILQAALATTATGMALHATLKAGKPQERWTFENRWANRAVAKIKAINPISAAAGMGVVLLLLSAGVIFGVPHDRARAPQYGLASIRRWAPNVFFWLAYDPYPDLTEASISRRPAGWNGSDEQVASVDGLRANSAKFRYTQGYGAFFANAHLWRADFQGAFLSEADFRGADLGQSNLRFAIMDHARMNHANLDHSNLDGADMRRADLREANLSYTSLENAILVDARMDGSSFYTAKLPGATLTRAVLEKADLREAFLAGAHMDHADLRNAYLWSARLPGADLGGAQLENAILIDADLQGANLGGAQLTGTVLNGATLTGTSLEGADLRGALGLTASQVCSARSRRGMMLEPEMETQVEAACGKQ